MQALSTAKILIVLVLQLIVQGQGSSLLPPRKVDCDTDPVWQLTAGAWQNASVDQNLASWWNKTKKANSNAGLANELASQFGAKTLGFNCSIDSPQTCTVPGCQPYVDNGDPPWTFLALNAVVNLNAYLNRIYEGSETGQEDFTDQAGVVAQTFFPWEDPKFADDDAAIWVAATIGAIFSFISFESRAVTAGTKAISAFIQAGAAQLELNLNPNPDLTLNQGLATLTNAAGTYAQKWRAAIEGWDTTLFDGNVDSQNRTILDYLHEGIFVSMDLPKAEVFEDHWLQSLNSRMINSQWRTRCNFVTFALTDDENISVGPNVSKYYSAEDGGVYYLYQWKESKYLLDEPDDMDQLENITSILPSEVTQSSAASWKAAGFNYTEADALSGLQNSLLLSNGSYYTDGAAAPGFWTIPVCNMTDFWRWNGQYGKATTGPCCCGENCKDTGAFLVAANLYRETFLDQCSGQLEENGICANYVIPTDGSTVNIGAC